MVWWLTQSRGEGWLDPLRTFSTGTVLAQWAVALALLLALNRWLARRTAGPEEAA